MTIKIRYKPCFGDDLFEPACELSRLFCELLGQKTLTRENLRVIGRMGVVIEVEQIAI